jgi:hypothetical protein
MRVSCSKGNLDNELCTVKLRMTRRAECLRIGCRVIAWSCFPAYRLPPVPCPSFLVPLPGFPRFGTLPRLCSLAGALRL